MIELTYLSHSSFLLKCGKTSVVFDPWLKGGAYYNQWYLWPLPQPEVESLKPDLILISHGHEDHLHTESLRMLGASGHIFFPFQWRAGIKPYLKHLGFNQITEATTFKTYTHGDIKITYIGFSLESVIVVEYENEVVVNINDALNSNHENAVNFILKEIKKGWQKIDYLLSGWSGASYFPNQVKYKGKDDMETGKLREQYFANNFFRFTNYLKPRCAVAFAPGFILLESANQWINRIKFPRTKMEEYYSNHFEKESKTIFLAPFPGDIIKNGELEKKSPLHALNEEEQYALACDHYEEEIEKTKEKKFISEEQVDVLAEKLSFWVNKNKILYDLAIYPDIIFSVKFDDVKGPEFINITYEENAFKVIRDAKPIEGRKVLITTSAEKLLYSLGKVWGGDILTIGYGVTVEVYNQLTLEKNLDIVCMRLITRYPITREDLLKYPLRAMKFYIQNPAVTTLWLKQKIQLKPYINKYPYNERDHWLTYNKCDLCMVCKMPEINIGDYA